MGKCSFIQDLVALTKIQDSNRFITPARCKIRRWLGFCQEAEIIGVIVSPEGAFYPWTTRRIRGIVMELYTVFLTEKMGTPPSCVEAFYSAALIPSKQNGVDVVGLKVARGRVDRHKGMHVPKIKTALSDQDIRIVFRMLAVFVFGKEGKRKSMKKINKTDVIMYFLVITTALLAIRNASLVPAKVKSNTFRAFLVWKRDVCIDRIKKTVKIQVFEKPERLKGSCVPKNKSFPKIQVIKGSFLGPYRAALVVDELLSEEEKGEYLKKAIWNGTRESIIVRSNITAWLKKTSTKIGLLKMLKTSLPEGYVLTCQKLRRQTMTVFNEIANSPNELVRLSGHARPSTTLDSYVMVTDEREKTLKEKVGKFLCTELTQGLFMDMSFLHDLARNRTRRTH